MQRMYGLKNTSSMMICFWLDDGSFHRRYVRILAEQNVEAQDSHDQEGDIDDAEDAGAGHDDDESPWKDTDSEDANIH